MFLKIWLPIACSFVIIAGLIGVLVLGGTEPCQGASCDLIALAGSPGTIIDPASPTAENDASDSLPNSFSLDGSDSADSETAYDTAEDSTSITTADDNSDDDITSIDSEDFNEDGVETDTDTTDTEDELVDEIEKEEEDEDNTSTSAGVVTTNSDTTTDLLEATYDLLAGPQTVPVGSSCTLFVRNDESVKAPSLNGSLSVNVGFDVELLGDLENEPFQVASRAYRTDLFPITVSSLPSNASYEVAEFRCASISE